ncbi:MAG: DUF1566 domain-containing protein [Candidatus Aminicenantes bacterium]|nr:DUF1566 domain-containing protein [Candidatus Aminicenantes bacterium]NIQ66044.1 DUF1566 domain-containing protein [Candidatus Aminicenantes bacterium]NIT22037.1 DUF1566 domain-containing protein [Candidatus Aminicenantes bacterium]
MGEFEVLSPQKRELTSDKFSFFLFAVLAPVPVSYFYHLPGKLRKLKGLKMRKLFVILLITLLLSSFEVSKLHSQERRVKVIKKESRIALVIGNGAYKTSPLRNPVNDANDIADVLREKGFDVTLNTNASKPTMINSIREFGRKLRKGGVGLFYYAGHGMQVDGMNYLIPADANIQAEHEIPLESVNVNRILGYMKKAKNRLNMLILDACRDNPFARSFRSTSRGLAQMDSPLGTLIAYSTAPGKTAADGSGRNGIYTKHLLTHIRTSNLEVGQMLRVVRSKVRIETNGKQVPWESTSLEGNFYFSTFTGTKLRSSYQTLSSSAADAMIKQEGFFDSDRNKSGSFNNNYQARTINGDKVVIDWATGLMWHQSGSLEEMILGKVKQWIDNLNSSGYAGYYDWRLPTLEEGASLIESSRMNGDLYIDPVFSSRQLCIWIGDKTGSGDYDNWVVCFDAGKVLDYVLGGFFVRPVRTKQ